MRVLQFETFPVWVNFALFGVAAACVWSAGTRLARYADAISARTHLSKAFLGVVVLGVATSLPEIATTITAAAIGNARLVSGNLFGGVALQIALLAVVDLIAVRGALTFFTPEPVLLFQGVMLLLLLSLALAGALAGEPISLMGLGMTPMLLALGYAVTVKLSQPGEYLPRWRATHEPTLPSDDAARNHDGFEGTSHTWIYAYSGASALIILAAGWVLARTGDALAEQTGLGPTFVGVALVASSTSLPELSTSLEAVRRGNHQMAVSNILGTNCLEVALFFLADAVYRGGPILATLDASALFAAALGMVVTCIFLLGLLERRDRTVLGMGVDSLAVLVVYVVGLVGLYALR
jgi:cation:H+ antiporter